MPVAAAFSEEELLRTKDFAHYTAAERAAARALLERLARRGPRRLSRRTRATRRRHDVHDLRATVRASLRHSGELVERRFRADTLRQRPMVLVVDVSGSMAPYARMLLQYTQAAVAARRRVEAFVFGTRLTRITRELHGRDPDRALERATAHVVDMGGGTRIGDALSELNRVHGRRLGRGSVVVVLSDGWDRGDPEELVGRDGAAAADGAPARVAQPAGGRPRLRAAHARHAGRPPPHRPPAAGQLDRVAGGAGRAHGDDRVSDDRLGCLVLAAGEGRRFGGPKQLAPLEGRPLLSHVVELAAPWDPVVVLGARADEVRAAAIGPGVRTVVAADWADGQSASLRAGVAALGADVAWVLVLLGDMPRLTRATVEAVLAARGPDVDAVRAVYDGRPGPPRRPRPRRARRGRRAARRHRRA